MRGPARARPRAGARRLAGLAGARPPAPPAPPAAAAGGGRARRRRREGGPAVRGRVAAGSGSWFAGGALEWATGAFSGQAVLDSPHLYFLYLCGAGLGIPLSEDALVVWMGSRLAHGAYSSAGMAATAVATVYAGVVLSDTMTFAFGRMLQKGLFPGMKEKLVGNSAKLAKAQAAIGRWGGESHRKSPPPLATGRRGD